MIPKIAIQVPNNRRIASALARAGLEVILADRSTTEETLVRLGIERENVPKLSFDMGGKQKAQWKTETRGRAKRR